jgi:hypothetical protein
MATGAVAAICKEAASDGRGGGGSNEPHAAALWMSWQHMWRGWVVVDQNKFRVSSRGIELEKEELSGEKGEM